MWKIANRLILHFINR